MAEWCVAKTGLYLQADYTCHCVEVVCHDEITQSVAGVHRANWIM